MNKIGLVVLLIIVAGFSTATVLGLQNGAMPEPTETTPEPPELARNTAINYILQAHEQLVNLPVPLEWETQNLTPGLLGASNLQYTADAWNVTVSYPVVLEPTYTIAVNYTGETSFQWTGTVSQGGIVAETSFTVQ